MEPIGGADLLTVPRPFAAENDPARSPHAIGSVSDELIDSLRRFGYREVAVKRVRKHRRVVAFFLSIIQLMGGEQE